MSDVSLSPQLSERKIINFSNEVFEITNLETLINAISAYFDLINTNNDTPTFTGLALSIGLTRKDLLNLPKDHPFTPTLEKAKQYIVEFAEKQLFEPKPAAGVQFWLKNNDGWTDKQEFEITKPKTILDILKEIDNEPIYDANTLPAPAEGKGMEIEKPLQDHQQTI